MVGRSVGMSENEVSEADRAFMREFYGELRKALRVEWTGSVIDPASLMVGEMVLQSMLSANTTTGYFGRPGQTGLEILQDVIDWTYRFGERRLSMAEGQVSKSLAGQIADTDAQQARIRAVMHARAAEIRAEGRLTSTQQDSHGEGDIDDGSADEAAIGMFYSNAETLRAVGILHVAFFAQSCAEDGAGGNMPGKTDETT